MEGRRKEREERGEAGFLQGSWWKNEILLGRDHPEIHAFPRKGSKAARERGAGRLPRLGASSGVEFV